MCIVYYFKKLSNCFGWGLLVIFFVLGCVYSVYSKRAELADSALYNSAKSVIISDITTIEELQNAINTNRELFVNGAVVVGQSYVALVDGANLTIQVVQSPVRRIDGSDKEETTPKDEKAGSLGTDK